MRQSSLLLALSLFACKDKGGDSGGSSGDGGDATAAVCTEATPIACTDQIILDLSLQDDKVADDADVLTEVDGEDFVTTVDATAGGYGNETQNPWVYVKFTTDGAVRVDIDDETALESMDWDMALRRFIIRLNGGDSGPSCVGVASLFEGAYAVRSIRCADYGIDDTGPDQLPEAA